jgi:hypothetical protein
MGTRRLLAMIGGCLNIGSKSASRRWNSGTIARRAAAGQRDRVLINIKVAWVVFKMGRLQKRHTHLFVICLFVANLIHVKEITAPFI